LPDEDIFSGKGVAIYAVSFKTIHVRRRIRILEARNRANMLWMHTDAVFVRANVMAFDVFKLNPG